MTLHLWLSAILVQALVSATPLTLAGLGELTAQRGGVINVGIEGMMLLGAITAFAVGMTGNPYLALAAAPLAGMALGLVFALATIVFRVDQIVCGMAINLLAVGISGTAWVALQNHELTALPDAAAFHRLWGQQYGLTYVVAGLCVAWWWALGRSRAGIIVRALGVSAQACAANGIAVRRWRVGLVLLGGACAGTAGAFLSIMDIQGFEPGMTGGRGFLVLALVIFGRWRVEGLVAGSLFFGALDSLQVHFQGLGFDRYLPYQAFQMLPYGAALCALAVLSRSAPGPAQLGRPYPARS